MAVSDYEVVVIGGGPGGSTAASFLAKAGRKVLLLEKERFPRFHIGESLLPYNHRIFEELGVLSRLEAEGFPKKYGAQFHLGNAAKNVQLIFKNGRFTREPMAFQVERSRFDHILLQHSASCGAEVREGWTVNKFSSRPDSISVLAESDSGENSEFRAACLIDASGRSNLTGNQEGLRVIHPRLKKIAIFAHYLHVRLDPGEKRGDTVIVRLKDKWFWLIPLSSEKTSVGCVLDREEWMTSKMDPEELFEKIWRGSESMRERMGKAERTGPFHTTGDFSYYNRRLTGDRLLRVGDAAGFMDPIFSAGVYLAMYSAKLAAETIDRTLAEPPSKQQRWRRYEKRVFEAMEFYWELVEHFYTTPFMEVFLEPRSKFDLPAAVTAVLAGELEGGWTLRWRLRLFYLIVKLQGKFPLLPRISFDSPGGAHLDTTTNEVAASFLPLPAKHEWGEGRGEGCSIKTASSPQPSPPSGEEREKTSS